MPKKRRTEANLRTVVINMLIGATVGTAAYFVLTAVLAFICLKRDVAPDGYGFTDLAIGAFAGILCGFFAVKSVRKKGFLIGALSTMPMYFVIAGVCILVSHDGIGMFGWILGAVLLISGAVGGIIAVR